MAVTVRADGTPARVLVVDDEATLAELVSMALRYEGWEVASAGDGAAAVGTAREFRPDVVVLDIMLPGMDRLEVLRRLRADTPALPVLFLTAKDAVEDRIAGLTAGGDDYAVSRRPRARCRRCGWTAARSRSRCGCRSRTPTRVPTSGRWATRSTGCWSTVALAPAIAALVAIPARELWRERHRAGTRLAMAATVAATGAWNFALLARTPQWLPPLRWCVLVLSVLVAVALVTVPVTGVQRFRRATVTVLVAALLAGATASAAYAVDTAYAAQDNGGSIPTSGPGGQGGLPGGGAQPGGSPPGEAPRRTSAGPSGEMPPAGREGSPGGPAPGAGPGRATANGELADLLASTDTRWAAATVGSQQAASLELATGKAVVVIGGFTGSDPYPTLDEFQRYVTLGEIRYLVAGGGPGHRSGTGSAITAWVDATFPATTVGGQTVYDLGAT